MEEKQSFFNDWVYLYKEYPGYLKDPGLSLVPILIHQKQPTLLFKSSTYLYVAISLLT